MSTDDWLFPWPTQIDIAPSECNMQLVAARLYISLLASATPPFTAFSSMEFFFFCFFSLAWQRLGGAFVCRDV